MLTDEELAGEYLKGDERTLEILIQRYLKIIYNFAYKNVGDWAAAEDIAQETFVRAWKNLNKFDQKKKFRTWLFAIAKNASIDYLRKRKTLPINDNIPAGNFLDSIADKLDANFIMGKLLPEQQELVRLKQDFSFKEISQKLNKPLNTVKSAYRRIILKFKK